MFDIASTAEPVMTTTAYVPTSLLALQQVVAGATAPAAGAPEGGLVGWAVTVMETLGAPGVGILVALESLFPPLPSEVFLPLAGFAAGLGKLSLTAAVVWATLGSLLGAWALYWLGAVLGRERLHRIVDRMPLVDVEDMTRAEDVFARHGRSAVLFGRVMPLVRSLISIPAGIERMPFVPFTLMTLVGSLAWNAALIAAGFLLGDQYDKVQAYVGYVQYVMIAVVVVLLIRYALHLRRRRRGRRSEGSRERGPDGPGSRSGSQRRSSGGAVVHEDRP